MKQKIVSNMKSSNENLVSIIFFCENNKTIKYENTPLAIE